MESSTPAFEPVPRGTTLVAQVVAELEGMIVSQRLSPGDKLPPERELALQFGVSRTVVREALTHLSARSWLESALGGGTLVKTPSAEHLSQSITLLLRAGEQQVPHAHVLEVRRMLEIEIAGLAATRRTDSDVVRLEELLAAMRELANTRDEEQLEAIMRLDVEFHAALAASAGNPLCSVLLDSVADILLAVRRLGMRDVRSHQNALHFHGEILEAVKQKNADAARCAMQAHLIESEETMRRAALQLQSEGKSN